MSEPNRYGFGHHCAGCDHVAATRRELRKHEATTGHFRARPKPSEEARQAHALRVHHHAKLRAAGAEVPHD